MKDVTAQDDWRERIAHLHALSLHGHRGLEPGTQTEIVDPLTHPPYHFSVVVLPGSMITSEKAVPMISCTIACMRRYVGVIPGTRMAR
jgi:hypothetical protein